MDPNEAVPPNLQPIVSTRSGEAYRRLQPDTLSLPEKEYLGRSVLRADSGNEVVAIAEIAARYGLARRTVEGYAIKVANEEPFHGDSGRPAILDEISSKEIVSMVHRRVEEKNAMSEEEINSLIADEAKATAIRRNQPPESAHMCARTIKRVWNRLGLRKRKPEYLTNVRKTACLDFRMTYSALCMFAAFSPPRNLPCLVWNFNSTQFTIRICEGATVVGVTADCETKCSGTTQSMSEEHVVYIKWLHMGCATGDTIPCILQIAAEDLDEEELVVIEVPTLTLGSNVSGIGYVVLTKSRAGNSAFFRWFIGNIIGSTIAHVRQAYHCDDMRAWITCVGEAIELASLLEQSALDLFEELKIDVGILPASTSGIHQASDASPLFRAMNARIRANCGQNTILELPLIGDALHRSFSEEGVARHFKKINSTYQNGVVEGLLRVAETLKDFFQAQLVKEGFITTGQFPLDFDKVINQSFIKLTPAERRQVKERLPVDVAKFRAHGLLTEDDLDESQIPTLPRAEVDKPRDERAAQHNRAMLLTHCDTVAKFQEELRRRNARSVPLTAEDAVNKEAMRILEREEKMALNKQAAVEERQEAKLLASCTMASQEIAEYKAAKRRAREAKDHELQAKVEWAKPVVSSSSSS